MLEVRISDEPASAVKVFSALAEHIHELPCGQWFEESLQRIMLDRTYRFVTAEDEPGGPLAAAGVITFFLQPMADTHVLAVEALWFRDDDLGAQLPVWRALVTLSQRMEFGGVCISANSTNTVPALRELAERGVLDDCPVTLCRIPLQKQGNPSPVRSAFSNDTINDSAFISVPAVVVHTHKIQMDLSGREYVGSAPLYRGEGRLECLPHWDCTDLDALAAVHFAKGFHARPRALPTGSSAPFGGTIAEQLLHQGYIGQGAVSLSTSFQVAAMYATHARQREEALVFTVDTEQLARHTKIFDAGATLSAACPWIPRETWAPLRRVVEVFWTDLPAAGRFLERCYEEAFERARVGAGSLAPAPDPFSFFSVQERVALETAVVSGTELLRVYAAFEEFAEYAQQRIGSVDVLNADSQAGYAVETHRVGPMAYFEVFARILDALRAARPDAEPGWDTTPMGYIAKTGRDDECFAAGAVPGEFIVEAHVIDQIGRPVRRLIPSRISV
jgi:hypothetical protein